MNEIRKEVISFGAGCFWGVEHAFKQVEGVLTTKTGYQGGDSDNPTYEEVCRKETNHAEVVLVEFDANTVSFERLLDAFFFMHDATQENRQGPDVGSQYRSCIFVANQGIADLALAYIVKNHESIASKGEGTKVMTEVVVNSQFHFAEIGHQDYLIHNPSGYCHIGLDVFQKLKQGLF